MNKLETNILEARDLKVYTTPLNIFDPEKGRTQYTD
jgi:hypothetical protein